MKSRRKGEEMTTPRRSETQTANAELIKRTLSANVEFPLSLLNDIVKNQSLIIESHEPKGRWKIYETQNSLLLENI